MMSNQIAGALDDRSIEVEVVQKTPSDKGGVIQVDSPVSVQEVLGECDVVSKGREDVVGWGCFGVVCCRMRRMD